MEDKDHMVNPEALFHLLMNENEILKLQITSLVDVLLDIRIISREDLTKSMNENLHNYDSGTNIQNLLDDASYFDED